MKPSDYDWYSAQETDRFHGQGNKDPADRRDVFEQDRARIIHSIAFRRLQGKTQVFAPAWADFMRSRVTHSIEVAQIGRGIAGNLGVPESLVEAACVAHDLGHPPFGHTGEAILNELMGDYGGFEGNAQTFRIITRLERKTRNYDGLNLTRATLLGTIKYPYIRASGEAKYLYADDVADPFDRWLYQATGRALLNESSASVPRTLVCDIMDWSDDVAYSVHDLEDGLASGFLLPSAFEEPSFVNGVMEHLGRSGHQPERGHVEKILADLRARLGPWEPTPPKGLIREVTSSYIEKFVVGLAINGTDGGSTPFDWSLARGDLEIENRVLKAVTFEWIIRDERMTRFVYKGREIVRRVFDALYTNAAPAAGASRYELFPRDIRTELAKHADDPGPRARIVCDYVASMTEGQAITLYSRLFEARTGSPFEHL